MSISVVDANVALCTDIGKEIPLVCRFFVIYFCLEDDKIGYLSLPLPYIPLLQGCIGTVCNVE